MAITPGFKEEGATQLTEAAGFAAVGDGGTALQRAGVLIAVKAVREAHPAAEVAIGSGICAAVSWLLLHS